MRRCLIACLLATQSLAVACSDDQLDPTGDLERPSGLVVVPRGVDREDLLIADAEAQGVRVQQYFQAQEPDANNRFAAAIEFVLSPSIYFPLVIPAEGFPTEVVVAAGGQRAYAIAAIAPVRDPITLRRDPTQAPQGRLYVMDVRPSETVPGRAQDPGNETLGSVDLEALAPGAIPMDLAVIQSDANESQLAGTDRVAVLADRLDGTGVLLVMDVSSQEAEPKVSFTEAMAQAELGEAPRALALVPTSTASPVATLLVALAGQGEQVTQVDVDGTSAQTRAVDVGGPVSRIVPVDATRALALRADIPAVIVLEKDPSGAFVRSRRAYTTPFTPSEIKSSTAALGRIDLSETVVSGAMGWPDSGFPAVDEAADVGVVMLSLLGGQAAFLRGDSLELVVSSPAAVSRLRPTSPTLSPPQIRECADNVKELWCANLDEEVEQCAGLVRVAQPQGGGYRAVYRGQLLSTRSFLIDAQQITTQPDGAEVWTTLFSFEQLNLADHLIAPGDEVMLQVPHSCDVFSAGWQVQGFVQAAAEALEISFVLGSTGTPGAAQLEGCNITGALLDVLPAGPEVVLQHLDGQTVAEVEARVPLTSGVNGLVARLESRADGAPTSIAATLVWPADTDLSTLGLWQGADARRCDISAECGPGRLCTRLPDSGTDTCPSVCDLDCQEGVDCNPNELAWIGSGVEFTVDATLVTAADLGEISNTTATQLEITNAVPYETVWLPVWQAWATSFPGSRSVVRVRATTGGLSVGVTR